MIDFQSFLEPSFIIQGIKAILLFSGLSVIIPPLNLLLLTSVVLIITSFFLKKSIKFAKFYLFVLASGFILFFLTLSFWPIINYAGPFEMYMQTKSYINKHESGLVGLFTKDFDNFSICVKGKDKEMCEEESNQQLLDRVSRDNTLHNFSSTYFIRLSSSGEIQKLHIGGSFETKNSESKNEKKIAKFIKSNSSFFLYAFIDEGHTPHYLDNRGEGEIFVPVKVEGKTVGVVVRIYAS